jgi:hypothetical protein
MTRDVHRVPGRIRFKVEGLRDDEALAWALPQALGAQTGVARVEVRQACSSLIVHYDPLRTDGPTLARFINQQVTGTVAMRPTNGTSAGAGPAAVLPPPTGADASFSDAMRQMAIVFGHTAFKVALQQVVQGSLNSLFRGTLGRI